MFKVMGKSKHGVEEIDTADTFGEAAYMAKEYRLAFGSGWQIWVEAPSTVLA